MSSALAAESAGSPVSAPVSNTWVGTSLWIDGVRGIARTVSARSCRFLASSDRIRTGRSPLFGGSVSRLTNQISPRAGVGLGTYKVAPGGQLAFVFIREIRVVIRYCLIDGG